MNKKILFYYSQLGIGGAERSLVRFMNALVNDGNDITLLTRYSGGECVAELDGRIKVISMSKSNDFLKSGKLSHLFGRIRSELEKIRFVSQKRHEQESFDLMVLGSHGMSPFPMLRIFKIGKCIKCIRNDLKFCSGKEKGIETIKKYADKIDGYLCVSGTTKQSFDEAIPEEAKKSFVLYNFLDTVEMQRKLDCAENPYEEDGLLHIATVCRISDVSKGIFRMLDVCERLKKDGMKFKWYLVGDGADLQETKKRIKEKSLEDFFLAVGKRSNPFGFYKYADLVAVLSYYEGLCGIVNEAKISGAAVIATEFSGIHEQITDGVNGWIVNNKEDAIYEKLKLLLTDTAILSSVKNTIYPDEIINDAAKLQKLYRELGWITSEHV